MRRGNGHRSAEEIAQIWDELIEHIIDGGFITPFCKAKGIDRSTIWAWTHGDTPEQKQRYKELVIAEQLRCDYLVDEIIEIADDSSDDYKTITKNGETIRVLDAEHVQRSRVKIDTRKWIACKQYKRKYGDTLAQEISGPEGGPVQIAGVDRPAPVDYATWKKIIEAEQSRTIDEDDED